MPSSKARVCSSVTDRLPGVHGILGLSPSTRKKKKKKINQSKDEVNSQRQISALAFPSYCSFSPTSLQEPPSRQLVTSSPTNQATNTHTCSASFTFFHSNYQTTYHDHISYIYIPENASSLSMRISVCFVHCSLSQLRMVQVVHEMGSRGGENRCNLI